MIRILCLSVLLVFAAHPLYAGSGTIQETDEAIIIEYSGNDEDVQAAKTVKEEQQKENLRQEQAAETKLRKIDNNAARAAQHRLEEEGE